jgi:hypothetical protein
MVDNAILVEHARKEMGEQKRKFESQGQSSNNSHPYLDLRKGHLSDLEGRTSTSAPINRTRGISMLQRAS